MIFVAACFEPVTWLIHRHIMHGCCWRVHQDHHDDTAYLRPELYLNDAFPLVFAVPSSTVACGVFAGVLPPTCASIVLGALIYGLAYLYVHEELFHRRFGLPYSSTMRRIPYVKRLATAHGVHHRKAVSGKKIPEGPDGVADILAFGFLYAPPRFSPELVRHLPASNETFWSYYGPLFGFYSECDLRASAC